MNASSTMAVMPIFYNSASQPVNVNTSSPLPAGYYYLGPGSTQQIYYYGNGVYYDAASGVYGGSAVNDPNGTAGVQLGYSSAFLSTPGLPNTGLGGQALIAWSSIVLSLAIAAIGLAYVIHTRPRHVRHGTRA